MDQETQAKLKELLLKEKEQIELELGKFTSRNPMVQGDYQTHFHKSDQSDTLDEKAHSVTEYEEEKAVEQNLESRLKEINETIIRLDTGTYGACYKCQSPIDEKRLKVLPVAGLCMDCAKKVALV